MLLHILSAPPRTVPGAPPSASGKAQKHGCQSCRGFPLLGQTPGRAFFRNATLQVGSTEAAQPPLPRADIRRGISKGSRPDVRWPGRGAHRPRLAEVAGSPETAALLALDVFEPRAALLLPEGAPPTVLSATSVPARLGRDRDVCTWAVLSPESRPLTGNHWEGDRSHCRPRQLQCRVTLILPSFEHRTESQSPPCPRRV